MIIGITGGIGSGKSTIARALAARGFAIYECDKEAKRIIAENKEVQQQIIALFGEKAFVNGVYNTQYISQCVFSASPLGEEGKGLAALNSIVHPAVKEDILQRSCPVATRSYSEAVLQAQPVLFIESAILYEAGLDEICDRIIMVEAPEDVCIARTIQRDYNGEATEENINKVRARIQAQKKAVRRQTSDVRRQLSVYNDGKASIEELVEKITLWMWKN